MKLIKNLLGHKQLLLTLAVFWTALIGFLCLDTTADLPVIKIKNIDKVAHFCFHFGFTWLWFLYFICQKNTKSLLKFGLLAFLLSLVYGISIEWAQDTYTTTRKADITDVFANVIGATTGIFAVIFLQKSIKTIN